MQPHCQQHIVPQPERLQGIAPSFADRLQARLFLAAFTLTFLRLVIVESLLFSSGDGMVCIRAATVNDLLAMQACNLLCLPENYQLKVCQVQSTHILRMCLTCLCCAVLLLPCLIMAAATTCGRGLQWKHCGLCISQNVSHATEVAAGQIQVHIFCHNSCLTQG